MKDDKKIVNREEREESVARSATEAQADVKRGEALPVSPEELMAILREESLANALPNPPKIPGWHLCWLSTTNTYTPIQQYVRLGYVPVRPEEMPEWSYLKQHGASHGGDNITCNEMILYKIPEDAYQQIMRVLHHERPMSEAERLKSNIEEMRRGSEFRDSEGNPLVKEEGDGLDSILGDRRVKVGTFQ